MGRPRRYPTHAARQRAYRARQQEAARCRDIRDLTRDPTPDPLWPTPQAFFEKLDAEFHFTLDVCALPGNATCARYFTPEQDGLRQDWGREICWMNPPYGRGPVIGRWVRKARLSAAAGATVVGLLPSSTDTRWWHQEVLPSVPHAAQIRWVEGRLKFGDGPGRARFANVVVIFWPPRGTWLDGDGRPDLAHAL